MTRDLLQVAVSLPSNQDDTNRDKPVQHPIRWGRRKRRSKARHVYGGEHAEFCDAHGMAVIGCAQVSTDPSPSKPSTTR